MRMKERQGKTSNAVKVCLNQLLLKYSSVANITDHNDGNALLWPRVQLHLSFTPRCFLSLQGPDGAWHTAVFNKYLVTVAWNECGYVLTIKRIVVFNHSKIPGIKSTWSGCILFLGPTLYGHAELHFWKLKYLQWFKVTHFPYTDFPTCTWAQFWVFYPLVCMHRHKLSSLYGML